MSWNYRIVKYADGSGFGVHEVYYDDDGKPKAMTMEPIDFTGDSVVDVCEEIKAAASDCEKQEVFEEPAKWRDTEATEAIGSEHTITVVMESAGYTEAAYVDDVLKVDDDTIFANEIVKLAGGKPFTLRTAAVDLLGPWPQRLSELEQCETFEYFDDQAGEQKAQP